MFENGITSTSMANNYSIRNYTDINATVLQAEIFKTILLMAIAIFGITVNGIICHTIFNNKHLRMPVFILISNMAISDIISLIAVAIRQPFVLFIVLFNKRYQLWYEIACKISTYGIIVGFAVSTTTLTVISIERYVKNHTSFKSQIDQWYKLET